MQINTQMMAEAVAAGAMEKGAGATGLFAMTKWLCRTKKRLVK